MPRNARLIIPNMCHHAIQRGNNHQGVFKENDDRLYYLKWARKLAEQYHAPIIGYCLMTNHTHILIFPSSQEGMINFMKLLAQRYSRYYNRKYHLHPLDPDIYYVVLRYIERNPASAAYHLSGKEDKTVMADYLHESVFSYREFFYEQERSGDIEAIREAAQQGKAWGRAVFLERLGSKLGRVVVPRKRGRPKKEEK